MADDNSLSGRVQRYAKVGTTIGGLAARTVGGAGNAPEKDQRR